jgi:hypothetical protein
LCPSSRGFKISPWGMYRYRHLLLHLSYQIFWLSNTFFASSWRRMGNNCGDYYLCIVSFHGSLYPPKQ